MLKNFYSVTKPGIIYGNLITVAGGFFLASRGDIHLGLFLVTILGISLIVASGCVYNNVIDRDIDKVMERTKNRVLVQGLMSAPIALIYATFLGLLGISLLYTFTNNLTVIVATIGLFVYVAVYSLWFKRNSIHGTIIGSISGAVPPVVGYCAVTNHFDLGAVILFFILSLWQMPHSFAIAIYRLKDYTAASISILPVKKGIYWTKINMLGYTIAFVIATLMLNFCGYVGWVYLVVVGLAGLYWIRLAIQGFYTMDDRIWARKMFFFSIIIIMLLSFMMAVDFTRIHTV